MLRETQETGIKLSPRRLATKDNREKEGNKERANEWGNQQKSNWIRAVIGLKQKIGEILDKLTETERPSFIFWYHRNINKLKIKWLSKVWIEKSWLAETHWSGWASPVGSNSYQHHCGWRFPSQLYLVSSSAHTHRWQFKTQWSHETVE